MPSFSASSRSRKRIWHRLSKAHLRFSRHTGDRKQWSRHSRALFRGVWEDKRICLTCCRHFPPERGNLFFLLLLKRLAKSYRLVTLLYYRLYEGTNPICERALTRRGHRSQDLRIFGLRVTIIHVTFNKKIKSLASISYYKSEPSSSSRSEWFRL